jgi:hypothetical protein
LVVSKEFFYKVWPHVSFSIEFALQNLYIIILIGYVHINQTSRVEKNSIGLNLILFLDNSYETKEPSILELEIRSSSS